VRRLAVSAVLVVLLAAGCGGGGGGSTTTAAAPPPPPAPRRVKVEYTNPASPIERILRTSGSMEEAAAILNGRKPLPGPVTVRIGAGGEEPAYDPKTGVIAIPNVFSDTARQSLRAAYSEFPAATVNQTFADLVQVVLVHQLAHAIVHRLGLKQDEETVSRVTAALLVKLGTVGGEAAFGLADVFDPKGRKVPAITRMGYWDEHSIDRESALQLVCRVYGSDTEVFADLALAFPIESAARCRREYLKSVRPIERRLAPYLSAG
jgi:hypothetical protein